MFPNTTMSNNCKKWKMFHTVQFHKSSFHWTLAYRIVACGGLPCQCLSKMQMYTVQPYKTTSTVDLQYMSLHSFICTNKLSHWKIKAVPSCSTCWRGAADNWLIGWWRRTTNSPTGVCCYGWMMTKSSRHASWCGSYLIWIVRRILRWGLTYYWRMRLPKNQKKKHLVSSNGRVLCCWLGGYVFGL